MNMDIKESIVNLFPPFHLGVNRTLFECDFYDTHYRYFEQIDDEYLTAIGFSRDELLLGYNFDWPDRYLKIGLEALRSNCRPEEGIKTWKDVDYEYLYNFGVNCSYLSSEGFKFFLPAALLIFLSTDKNKAFIDCFILRLQSRWKEDNHVFTDDQKKIISDFLREYD